MRMLIESFHGESAMRRKEKKTESMASLRKKLYSALAMLLVSSIMMVSSSYAWLVLSTAPEVTGISTQVGANGSLEIVLLDTESYNDITKVAEADIDESASESLQSSNLSWGNLVDLKDAGYGLHQIILNPSRLNIEQSGTDDGGDDQYRVNSVLLKTPVYGEDGRITGLEQTAISTTFSDKQTFSYTDTQEYGVRAVGTSASMNSFQLGINEARSTLVTNMSSARTAASNSLNQTGSALANIAVAYALSSGTSTYTAEDVQALLDLAEGMQVSLDHIDTALRQVFAGYICTEEAQVSMEDYAEKKAEIEDKETSLSKLEALYAGAGEDNGLSDYIDLLEENQSKVENAIASCESMIAEGRDSYTEADILGVMTPLVNYQNMTMGGKTIDELKDMELSELFGIIAAGGLTLSVPTGSGLLSDIADFAGDYTAVVMVEKVSYGGYTLENQKATMATATTVDPVYLSRCSTILKGYTAGSDEDAGTVITDFYGYALDLAFRTNAVESNLLLQTESTQRIYEDSTSEATQGGGSYMEFTSNTGLSSTKMVKLMSALRVVFVDKEQDVLAVAALDTTLGKDAYTILEDAAEQEATGKYAVLTDAKVKQNSDYITKTEYDALPDTTEVELDAGTGAVKAPLYLREFTMTLSDTSTLGEEKYTGGITLGSKQSSNVITALEENVPQQVTAIVYLDGSFVTNSMVAADSSYSMTGTLNLQFASDGNLIPMNNQKLRDGDTEGGDSEG